MSKLCRSSGAWRNGGIAAALQRAAVAVAPGAPPGRAHADSHGCCLHCSVVLWCCGAAAGCGAMAVLPCREESDDEDAGQAITTFFNSSKRSAAKKRKRSPFVEALGLQVVDDI